MSYKVFNIAKGRINELVRRVANNDPATSVIGFLFLQSSEADFLNIKYETVAELLAAAGNTEATFTNYERKVVTGAELTLPFVDHVNNEQRSDIPDPVWTEAGGAVNNTLTKLITYFDPDPATSNDATRVPLTITNYDYITLGRDIAGIVNNNGFYSSRESVSV